MSTVDASANPKVRHNGHRRWREVDLVALIGESGCTLREKSPGKWVGDHAPKHGSKSGECMVVWPERGRWHCTSCGLGGDAAAWIAHLEDCDYAEACRRLEERFGPAPAPEGENEKQNRREKRALHVLRLARGRLELFHAPDSTPYAGCGAEVWRIPSQALSTWLSGLAYRELGTTLSADAVREVTNVLAAEAVHDGPEQRVFVRVAPLPGPADGAADADGGSGVALAGVVIDLADPGRHVAVVTPTGWRVAPAVQMGVRFLRPPGHLALPRPVRGGDLAPLWELANIPAPARPLVLAWLTMALLPEGHGAYPHLALFGEQGSGKSVTARMLAALIDPRKPALRAEPGNERDLMIAARNSWLLGFDNVSTVPPWLSDALCRLSTGAGYATRELYSDDDEVLFDAQRPLLSTGITEYVTRPDLLDRTIAVELPPIPEEQRRPERELWTAFEPARPAVFGALLDRLAGALRELPRVYLPRLPRMADFALVAVAAERGAGEVPAFLAAYEGARAEAHQAAVEASPIGPALLTLLGREGGCTGTAGELLEALRAEAGERQSRHGFPRTPRGLAGELRRLAPALKALGWTITWQRIGKDRARTITIDRSGGDSSPTQSPARSSAPSAESDNRPPTVRLQQATVRLQQATVRQTASFEPVADGADEADGGAGTSRVARSEDDRCAAPGCSALIDAFAWGGAGYCEQHLPPPDDPSPGPGAPSAAQDGVGDPDMSSTPGEALRSNPATPAPEPGHHGGAAHANAGARAPIVAAGPALPPFALLTDAAAVRAVLPALLAQPALGLDCETTGLDPLTCRLRLLQLATPERVHVIDLFNVPPAVLAPLFADPRRGPVLVGHNLKFDLAFLWAAGLEPPYGARLFDTMLADQLSRGCAPPRGLKDLTPEYLGQELDKAFQEADWSGELSPAMLQYAAHAAALVLPLHRHLRDRLRAEGLERVAELEQRCLPAIAWLEQTGCPFDFGAWEALAEQAGAERDRLAAELSERAGAAINWDSVPQVLAALHAAGLSPDDLPDTREETLCRHADHPLVSRLLAYREAAKRAGTYGKDWLAYSSPADGRVHADWHQIGAASGRMACRNPNLQNLPRDPRYRACVRPGAGLVLIKADYAQIELRIAAELAGERRMIEAFLRGEDLHRLTAALVLGKPPDAVTKDDRQLAKAINFGLLYGMGATAFAAHARTAYGVTLSEAQAAALREKFFQAYPALRRWHRAQPEGSITTRTLLGRKRFGVERFTEKLNTPVQGSGADGLKAALAELWETRERCPAARPVLAVHDEIVVEVATERAEAARRWLVACMTRGMQAVLREVPVEVEAMISRDLGGASP